MNTPSALEAFRKIDFRIGRIIEAIVFAKAKRPAYKLKVDFGTAIGIKNSSAQLTFGYPDPTALVGQLVVAVVNFAPRNIAGFMSECLVTGFYADEKRVFLLQPIMPDTPLGIPVQLYGSENDHQTKATIIFEDFLKVKIVLAGRTSENNGVCQMNCGEEFGVLSCPAPEGITANNNVTVLMDENPAILTVPTSSGWTALTASNEVPLGTLLA